MRIRHLVLFASMVFIGTVGLPGCAVESEFGHLPLREQVEYRTLRYIMTEREQRDFLALETDAQRTEWLDRFWLRRDPTPGTPRNERKDEHERRVQYAMKTFSTHGRHNGWWVDKGRVYIKYGEPDLLMEGQIGTTFQLGWEMWVYFREEYREFLKETVVEPQDIFETDMQKYTYSFVFDRENRIEGMTQGGVISSWSTESYRDNLRYFPLESYRLTVDQMIAGADFAIFRNASGADLIEIWYELPAGEFQPKLIGTDSIPDLEAVAMLVDTAFQVVTSETVRETSRVADWGRGRGVLGTVFLWPEAPGRYDLHLNFTDLQSERRGFDKMPVIIEERRDDAPGLSGIEFVLPPPPTAAGSRFYKGEFEFVPNPSRSYYRTEPLYFYFEAYGFGSGADRAVKLNVAYRILSRSNLLAPSEFSESMTAGGPVWAHTAKLDISKLPYDEYELQIEVSDDRGRKAAAAKVFRVVGWEVY